MVGHEWTAELDTILTRAINRWAVEVERRESGDRECKRLALLVKEVSEERDALKLSAEEGQEIIGELSMALAILTGEGLRPCREPEAAPGCPGHLGAKAKEVVNQALSIYRALQEGNRLAAERIVELDGRCEGLNRQAADAQERNALLEAANLRLMKEVADKAGEIRELQDWLEKVQVYRLRDAKRHRRSGTLLALLDSAKPPFGALAGVPPAHEHAAQALWRWLREQVKDHAPTVAPEGRQSSSL